MTLLGRPSDKRLEIAFDDLEKATGLQAIDAKLVGDILHIAHLTIRAMGLDGDVTAKELYQALRVHDDIATSETPYVGLVIGGQVVSFHSEDLASDAAAMRQFEARSLDHLHEALSQEIAERYRVWAAHPTLLNPIISHIQKETTR